MSKLNDFWASTQIDITNVATGKQLTDEVDALRKHFKLKSCRLVVDILKYGCGSGKLKDWRLTE